MTYTKDEIEQPFKLLMSFCKDGHLNKFKELSSLSELPFNTTHGQLYIEAMAHGHADIGGHISSQTKTVPRALVAGGILAACRENDEAVFDSLLKLKLNFNEQEQAATLKMVGSALHLMPIDLKRLAHVFGPEKSISFLMSDNANQAKFLGMDKNKALKP